MVQIGKTDRGHVSGAGCWASETSLRGLKSPAETWVVAGLTRATGNPLVPLHMQESLRLERPTPPMPASQAWV